MAAGFLNALRGFRVSLVLIGLKLFLELWWEVFALVVKLMLLKASLLLANSSYDLNPFSLGVVETLPSLIFISSSVIFRSP